MDVIQIPKTLIGKPLSIECARKNNSPRNRNRFECFILYIQIVDDGRRLIYYKTINHNLSKIIYYTEGYLNENISISLTFSSTDSLFADFYEFRIIEGKKNIIETCLELELNKLKLLSFKALPSIEEELREGIKVSYDLGLLTRYFSSLELVKTGELDVSYIEGLKRKIESGTLYKTNKLKTLFKYESSSD